MSMVYIRNLEVKGQSERVNAHHTEFILGRFCS
jgi:hypothetical protein